MICPMMNTVPRISVSSRLAFNQLTCRLGDGARSTPGEDSAGEQDQRVDAGDHQDQPSRHGRKACLDPPVRRIQIAHHQRTEQRASPQPRRATCVLCARLCAVLAVSADSVHLNVSPVPRRRPAGFSYPRPGAGWRPSGLSRSCSCGGGELVIHSSVKPSQGSAGASGWLAHGRKKLIRKISTESATTNAPTVIEQIPAIPAQVCAIGVNAARHPQNAQDVHREKDHIHADKHQPEMPFAQSLVEQAAR